jgi:hypothetical protein
VVQDGLGHPRQVLQDSQHAVHVALSVPVEFLVHIRSTCVSSLYLPWSPCIIVDGG